MQSQFSVQDVAQACRSALNRLLPDLPEEIGGRLKLQRVAQRHGTELRMFLYHIWDRHQPTLLDYHHFSYGVVYDPILRYHENPLLLRFYANRHRIYDKRNTVVKALWMEMQRAEQVLHRFHARENEQMIGLFREFSAKNVQDFESEVYQGFLELIPYWHLRYAAVVDHYGVELTGEDIRATINGRKKFQPTGPRSPAALTEYSRHVPSSLRAAVLARDGGKCLRCGATADLHVDHIVPVSLGGRTVFENLQTLCSLPFDPSRCGAAGGPPTDQGRR